MNEHATTGPAAPRRFRIGVKELLVAVICFGALAWAGIVILDRSHPERALARAIRSSRPSDRLDAVNAFRNVSQPEADQAIASLSVALKDEDGGVREAAAEALGPVLAGAIQVDQTAPAVNPGIVALLKALSDPSLAVRTAAAGSLGSVGAAGVYAPPDRLIATLKDDQPVELLIASCLALRHFQYEPDAAIGPLLAMVGHPEPRVGRNAASTLARLKPSTSVGPALAAGLGSANPEVRKAAAAALGRLSPVDDRTVATLIAAMKKADLAATDGVAAGIAVALGQAAVGTPAAADAVAALGGALKAKDEATRRRAAESLAKFGPAAKSAVPDLRALKDADPAPPVKDAVAKALEAIEPKP